VSISHSQALTTTTNRPQRRPPLAQEQIRAQTPFNSILEPVVRAFALHRYFRFFLSLFFSTPPNEFF
jgi:hypothetical protein